jgi:hypothetical protein
VPFPAPKGRVGHPDLTQNLGQILELASAIHDYIELWHNTRRRHSALAMRTPAEVEHVWATNNPAIIEAGSAKTATTGEVDEAAAAGLPAPRIEAIHPNHHLLTNNKAA